MAWVGYGNYPTLESYNRRKNNIHDACAKSKKKMDAHSSSKQRFIEVSIRTNIKQQLAS